MSIVDYEFGEITVRKSKLARSVKVSVGPNGKLRASLPFYAPEFSIKRLVRQNRSEIRELLSAHNQQNLYEDCQQIGKSHTLIFKETNNESLKITVEAQQIIAMIPAEISSNSPKIQAEIRETVVKILRKQAKSYLPRRLEFIAQKYDFKYEKVRFSHASSRWGSCSSNGTISLNIGLMNLPHNLIDYVLIHELCHTREMNHSEIFWAEVEKYDTNYKKNVSELKRFNPNI